MNDIKVTGGSGATMLDALCIAFIILKLCHVITWSWWIVLTPLWIELASVIIFIFVVIVMKKRGVL